jgi:hypothetical protein
MSTFLYNPDRKSKDVLITEFVVRTQVYEQIMHDLETSTMEHPEQHYLIVGQRGAGKTTLLNRLKYGVEDSTVLKDWLIPVIFSEEQYNITELANLWENVGQYLDDYHGFSGLAEEMEKQLETKNFEERCYELLEKHLQKHGKKLVLLIDNIGDLLKKMDNVEVHRLREVLQTKNHIRLIAGSPFFLESILDYQQPLFEFFKVVRLDGLDQVETQALLLKLAEVSNETEKIEKIIRETPGRIETLRVLTGGVPRTIALMFQIFVDYNNEDSVKDLEKILDAVTPLYKHRMDDLPVQQQKIVDAVARNWDGITVKELKDRVRLESKIVSAQLRQLEKDQVIEKVNTSGKNHIYMLKERFFNIWYLMRHGRKQDRQRVVWFVKFLESWCTGEELEIRVLNFLSKLRTGELTNHGIDFYGQVYSSLKNIDVEVKFLLRDTIPDYISSNVSITDDEIHTAIAKYSKSKEYGKAIELFGRFSEPEEHTELLITGSIMVGYITTTKDYKLMSSINDKVNKLLSDASTEGVYLSYNEMLVYYYFSIFSALLTTDYDDFNARYAMLETGALMLSFLSKTRNANYEYAFYNLTIQYTLMKGSYNLIFKVFEEVKHLDLKNIFKPTYYAVLYLKFGKHSNEFLRMGSELKEPVYKIIEELKVLQKEIISGTRKTN